MRLLKKNGQVQQEIYDGIKITEIYTERIKEGSMMTMQFSDVCFITEDVLRLRTFYESVFGGKTEGNEIHSSLMIEGLTFTFDYVAPLQENPVFGYVTGGGANNVIIGFNVDDADAEYQRLLLLGAEMLNQPTTHPWGARSFQFKDPDGNVLNFRSWPKGD